MKNLTSINENQLDGALNAIFLNTYSEKEDEDVAAFILEEDYAVVVDGTKERELLVRLAGEGKFKTWMIMIFALLVLLLFLFLYFFSEKDEGPDALPRTTSQNVNNVGEHPQQTTHTVMAKDIKTGEEKVVSVKNTENPLTATIVSDGQQIVIPIDTSGEKIVQNVPSERTDTKKPDTTDKKIELPYFDEAGLNYFEAVKGLMMLKIHKIDNDLYTRIDPGSTMFKKQEMLVHPFVMSSFPVTNLQYKVFLADLFREGKMEDMKRCLPKSEVWKEYNCNTLAKNYFDDETYNDFPVVNITKEAMLMFCKWFEKEMNEELNGPKKKIKTGGKFGDAPKKQIIVNLPYDYQWIYAADAYYALIPDCGGYNTIYDPSEGMVDKDFFKHTSQLNRWDKKKLTKMDKLNDENRFGMTEAEMLNIFKEALAFKDKKSSKTETSSYPGKMENCCLAGHVGELILLRDGGTMVRGCCWKDKAQYDEMVSVYKKLGASPFVGFRVAFIVKNTTNKDPFWSYGGK
jgi:hypothetical protein